MTNSIINYMTVSVLRYSGAESLDQLPFIIDFNWDLKLSRLGWSSVPFFGKLGMTDGR